MSDRARAFRIAAGILLMVFSAAAAVLPALHKPDEGTVYRPGAGRTIRMDSPRNAGGGEDRVNLNRADADELTQLSGIGEVYAGRIIAEREENGPFFYPEDLEAVSGIGSRTVEKIRDRIRMTDE